MRRLLRFLTAPRDVARAAASEGRGLGTLLALVALEVFIAQPRVWVSAVMRLRAAPAAALSMLYGAYTHALLPVLVAVAMLGLLRYYVGRIRTWPRVDAVAAAHAFSYLYLPHTLLVFLGGVAAACGVESAWLPQATLGALSTSAARWVKLLFMYGVSGAYLPPVWSSLRGALVADDAALREAAGANHGDKALGPAELLCAIVLLCGAVSTPGLVARRFDAYRPRAAGEAMPSFTVQGVGRAGVTSADVAGAPLLIDFWATWCPPCIAALPHLHDLAQAYESRGVRFLAVNVESDNRVNVEAFVRAHKMTLPVYLDEDGSMQEHFHVHMYPTTYLVNADGSIRKIYNGSVAADELRAQLDGMLAGDGVVR